MKFDPSIVQTRVATPLGEMCLAATQAGLAGAWFMDQRHRPDGMDFKSVPHPWPRQDAHPTLMQAAQELQEFFAGQRPVFEVVLDISGGTLFQQSVWRALLKIGYGKTTSYGSISHQIGSPKAVRAVGSAVGRNPLGVIVPCHRVLGGDGSLTGYAGGLHRKVALLNLEGAAFEGSDAAFKSAAATPSASTVTSPAPPKRAATRPVNPKPGNPKPGNPTPRNPTPSLF